MNMTVAKLKNIRQNVICEEKNNIRKMHYGEISSLMGDLIKESPKICPNDYVHGTWMEFIGSVDFPNHYRIVICRYRDEKKYTFCVNSWLSYDSGMVGEYSNLADALIEAERIYKKKQNSIFNKLFSLFKK